MNLKRLMPACVFIGLILLCLGQSTGWSLAVGPLKSAGGYGLYDVPVINSPDANWTIHETVSFDPTAPAWGANYSIEYTFPHEPFHGPFQYGQHIYEYIQLASDINGWQYSYWSNPDFGLDFQLSGLQADSGNGFQPLSFNSQYEGVGNLLMFETLRAGSTLLVDLVITGGGELWRVGETTDMFLGSVTVWQAPVPVVPEPATLGLAGVGLGLAALLRRGWRRMRLA